MSALETNLQAADGFLPQPAVGVAGGGADATASQPLVRRCKWCKWRTGAARYWHDGEWIHVPSPAHFFGSTNFTDGMCPECFTAETAKLNLKN